MTKQEVLEKLFEIMATSRLTLAEALEVGCDFAISCIIKANKQAPSLCARCLGDEFSDKFAEYDFGLCNQVKRIKEAEEAADKKLGDN